MRPKTSTAFKKPKKEAILFDVKGRFEFLNGFSKRKAERRQKGNLINLKKEQKRKREEQNLFKQHLHAEYEKTLEAVRHNTGRNTEVDTNPQSSPETPVIESRVEYFPSADKDPFGDVSVQITALESPEYSTMSRALVAPVKDESARDEKPQPAHGKPQTTRKLFKARSCGRRKSSVKKTRKPSRGKQINRKLKKKTGANPRKPQ